MADVNGFHHVPFFTGGGAEHAPELLRKAAYAWSSGGEGIAAPGDLMVTATQQASSQVIILPGAAIIRNRATGALPAESYVVSAFANSTVTVSPTGAAPRTDLIGVRIYDPEYPGNPSPPDLTSAANWPYVQPFRLANVDSNTLSLARQGRLNMGYPVYWCAVLNIPASTTNITSGMIESLRRLAQPLTHHAVEASGPTPEDYLNSTDGRVWPDFHPNFSVPAWATGATVRAELNSIGLRGGYSQGIFAVVFAGALRSENSGWDIDVPMINGQPGGSRHNLVVIGGFQDVTSYAGQSVQVRLEARSINKTTNPGDLVTVAGTQVIYTVDFWQRPF